MTEFKYPNDPYAKKESPEVINFYRANDPYGVFSNFDTRHPFTIDGVFWPSSEHYF